MRAELKDLCLAVIKAMSDANDGMWFTRDELEGMSSESLAAMKTIKSKGDKTQDRLWPPFRSTHNIRILCDAV